MTDELTPPAWVRKRDGSRVPFDADKIGQALFAATETLGRPDAFLARELTDGVLHFLAVEKDDDTLTTAQIADIVGKTVRELGQPALAAAFTAFAERHEGDAAPPPDAGVVLHAPRDVPPRAWLADHLREFTRQAIYSRQLLAAQGDGLLTLTGMDAPAELESCTVGPFESAVVEVLEELRRHVAGCAVFDSPEYLLLTDPERFIGDLALAARLLGLRAALNFNSAEPPPWAGDLARGPLFAALDTTANEAALASGAERLLGAVASLSAAKSCLRVHWHLAERDFAAESASADRLRRVTRLVAEGTALSFVFDRPRRPLLLDEGIDRQHLAVLLRVGLHLPRLAEQPGLRDDAALFLQKLGSLTRLAISAAVQKREYLRRLERAQPSALTTGFLLERARLVVVPVGLDAVVQHLIGRGLTSGGAALDLGKQIVTRLRDVLKQEGRTAHLDACLDGPWTFSLGDRVAGLTPWEPSSAVKNQLRVGGVLHGVAERGEMALFLDRDDFTPEGIAERLRQAWETSEVARLSVVGEPS